MLGIGRSVGETAAVIFTAGSSLRLPSSIFDSARTMSVHFYILAREGISDGKRLRNRGRSDPVGAGDQRRAYGLMNRFIKVSGRDIAENSASGTSTPSMDKPGRLKIRDPRHRREPGFRNHWSCRLGQDVAAAHAQRLNDLVPDFRMEGNNSAGRRGHLPSLKWNRFCCAAGSACSSPAVPCR